MENSEKKLEAVMENEIHKTVEWTDDKDKKHTTKNHFTRPRYWSSYSNHGFDECRRR